MKETLQSLQQKQITVIGDSIPKGLYLENKKICRIEQNAVSILAQTYGLSIENNSQFGQTLKKSYEKGFFTTFLAEQKGASVLVISLGGNDCDYDWKSVAEHPYAGHQPNTPLPEFEDLLKTVTLQLKNAGISPVFTALPPIDSFRYFQNVISSRADGERVLEFFHGDITNIARHQECYNLAILKNAVLNGCRFLDYRSPLLLQPDYLSYLADDGIHPNQKGHLAIAEFCKKYIDRHFVAERIRVG